MILQKFQKKYRKDILIMEKNKSKKFLNFILIMILFEPTIFVKYRIFNYIFIIGACISFTYILYKTWYNDRKINLITMEIIIFRVLLLINTIINKRGYIKSRIYEYC